MTGYHVASKDQPWTRWSGLGDEAEVTVFSGHRYVLVAKWWMRPICWILRRPTTITVYR